MKGQIILDLPPKKGNPRNSEGVFVRLNSGAVMFAYSKYSGETGKDDAEADIAAIYSYDGGDTFGGEEILFKRSDHGAQNIMSVSAQRLADGRLAFFYLLRKGFHDTRLFMRTSKDEAKTFDEGRYCINYPGYFVTNNDRVVVLSNGRLMVPASYHRCLGPDYDAWDSFDGKATARFFYSDDNGETFYESPGFGALNIETKSGLQEPGIVETAPGELLCYCRTDLGSQYVSRSNDYGECWEPFRESEFTSPVSPMSIKKIPGYDVYIAVFNPVPNSPETHSKAGWGRNPLVYALSRDGCKSFGERVAVEDDPESGFCYPSMFFTGDSMLLSYCAGGPEDKACLNRLRIRKIPIDDILKAK
jgi:hypothetical protein